LGRSLYRRENTDAHRPADDVCLNITRDVMAMKTEQNRSGTFGRRSTKSTASLDPAPRPLSRRRRRGMSRRMRQGVGLLTASAGLATLAVVVSRHGRVAVWLETYAVRGRRLYAVHCAAC